MHTAFRVEGEGPPLTLIHGVGASLESWHGVVRRLDDCFRVLRYDLRGHGRSGKPPGPYALDDFVADLAALLDHEGIERTLLAGFSFGGIIGPAFTLAHPGRVERLVAISATAGRTAAERAAVVARADALASGGADLTIDAALERWFTPGFRAANPEVIEARRKAALDNDPRGYAAAYRVFAESDVADDLHRIGCPCLITTGEDDPGSTPRMSRLMAERIPDARLEILAGLRHNVLLEAPERIAGLIAEFCAGPS